MPHISPETLAAGECLTILSKIARLEDETRQPLYHDKANNRKGFDGKALPVVAVAVYRSDIVVMRQGDKVNVSPGGTRKEIKEMSDESLRRLAFVANNANCDLLSMITLTYPNEFPVDGRVCKKHLDAMIKSLRRRLGDSLSYLWFLEFQRRGAPHFHILLSVALDQADKVKAWSWLSYRWYVIVGSGDDLHLAAGTRWENVKQEGGLRRYVVKYAAKTYQKTVPPGFEHVGRFWGNSKNLTVMPILLEAVDADEIKDRLADWPFIGATEQAIPRVLFNAADWWGTSA